MDYTLFVALGFFASIISAIFGFGTALFVLAIGSHILPVKETIALATVLFTASVLAKTWLFARHIDWKLVAIMVTASLPFAYLGASLLAVAPAPLIKKLLAAMVLIYLALSLFKLMPRWRIGTAGLIVGSTLYGFVSGLIGTGGLIKAILFKEMNIAKEAFVGAMAATSILANFAKLVAYAQTGILTREMAWPAVGLVAAALATSFIGRDVLRHFSVRQFEAGVQILLAVLTVGLLF